MSDLFTVLAEQDALVHPTTDNPEVRDTATGGQWHQYDRCPECNTLPCGPCYPQNPVQRTLWRIREGWLTLASCNCGRLRWRALDLRDGDFWHDTTADSVWGPIVPRPDDAAWMTGAPREEVLA